MGFQHTYEELKLECAECHPAVDWGFQHTYEELKLHITGQVLGIVVGFQHTYEELKQFTSATDFICRDPGFQHTYEELKQFLRVRLQNMFNSVFSIPMRN